MNFVELLYFKIFIWDKKKVHYRKNKPFNTQENNNNKVNKQKSKINVKKILILAKRKE